MHYKCKYIYSIELILFEVHETVNLGWWCCETLSLLFNFYIFLKPNNSFYHCYCNNVTKAKVFVSTWKHNQLPILSHLHLQTKDSRLDEWTEDINPTRLIMKWDHGCGPYVGLNCLILIEQDIIFFPIEVGSCMWTYINVHI